MAQPAKDESSRKRKLSVELIERFSPFRIESERDYCFLVIGPFSSLGWYQADVYMGQHRGFWHMMELSKSQQRDQVMA